MSLPMLWELSELETAWPLSQVQMLAKFLHSGLEQVCPSLFILSILAVLGFELRARLVLSASSPFALVILEIVSCFLVGWLVGLVWLVFCPGQSRTVTLFLCFLL
jgi:hypothetical protein